MQIDEVLRGLLYVSNLECQGVVTGPEHAFGQ
jgi:hypothetical protein